MVLGTLQGQPETAVAAQRIPIDLLQRHIREKRGEFVTRKFSRQGIETDHLAPRQGRWKQPIERGSQKYKDGRLGRLLERFEQRILSGGCDAVRFANDEHLCPSACGCQADSIDHKVAQDVHSEFERLAPANGWIRVFAIELTVNQMQVGMRLCPHRPAIIALSTPNDKLIKPDTLRVSVSQTPLDRLTAEENLSKPASERLLPNAVETVKYVRMVHATSGDCPLEHLLRVALMSDVS